MVMYLQWCSHISLAVLLIPSHNLRSQTPARIWQRPAASLAVSIPAYRPGSRSPSRSQMINSVSQHSAVTITSIIVVNFLNRDLVLLQDVETLCSRNGWVCFFFKIKNRHVTNGFLQ